MKSPKNNKKPAILNKAFKIPLTSSFSKSKKSPTNKSFSKQPNPTSKSPPPQCSSKQNLKSPPPPSSKNTKSPPPPSKHSSSKSFSKSPSKNQLKTSKDVKITQRNIINVLKSCLKSDGTSSSSKKKVVINESLNKTFLIPKIS